MLKKNYDDILMDSLNDLVMDSSCSKCGGRCDYHTGICVYCDSFNERLKSHYDEVMAIISSIDKDNISKSLILQLYDFIKNSDVSYDFLEKFDIIEKTKGIIKDLEYTDNYSSEDKELLEYIFTYDSFLNVNAVLRDLIIRDVILKRNTLDEELIKKVLRHLVISSTREYSEGSEFSLKRFKDGTNGETFRYDVFLSEEMFYRFYNEGNISMFFILAHEIRHTYQSFCRDNNIITSYIDLLALKEAILRGYSSDIYFNNKNYVNNLYEIDANVYSYYVASNYLMSLGISTYLDVDMEVSKETEKMGDLSREIDGEIVNINDFFADYVNDKPDLFNRFPQLAYEFKEENGNIIYKSKDEIIDEFLCSGEGMEEIYFNLIKNAKEREKVKNTNLEK